MNTISTKLSAVLCLCCLQSCVSYEPRVLPPAITFSPEEVSLVTSDDNGAAVNFGLDVTPNESDSLFNVEVLPGVRVRQVDQGGPADSAQIQVGDVILSINGVDTNHPDVLTALEQSEQSNLRFQFIVRRDTTVFETELNARAIENKSEPVELFRIDPIATRAGYSTRMLNIDGRGALAGAQLVEIFAKSTLPDSDINIGDIVIAINGQEINSAQNLINRLNQDFQLGSTLELTLFRNGQLDTVDIALWNPGRRISRISAGPLLNYESGLDPVSKKFSLLDLWLFSVYSYSRIDGEKTHSILGLLNYSSDLGELTEE